VLPQNPDLLPAPAMNAPLRRRETFVRHPQNYRQFIPIPTETAKGPRCFTLA
jgi:hypothetical protein